DGGAPHDVDEVIDGALSVLEEVEQGQDELAVLGQQFGELLGIEGRRAAGRRNDLIGFSHRWWLLCEGFDNPMIRIIARRSRHRSCQLSTKPGTSSPPAAGKARRSSPILRDTSVESYLPVHRALPGGPAPRPGPSRPRRWATRERPGESDNHRP